MAMILQKLAAQEGGDKTTVYKSNQLYINLDLHKLYTVRLQVSLQNVSSMFTLVDTGNLSVEDSFFKLKLLKVKIIESEKNLCCLVWKFKWP